MTLTERKLSPNVPVPGFYRARLERGGPWVGIAITEVKSFDEDGELLCDVEWRAEANGEEIPVERVWPWCAKHPITREEWWQITERARLSVGANNPPPEDTLTEAAVIAAEACFLTEPAKLVDTVKRAIYLLGKLDEERKLATAVKRSEVAEIELPYKQAHADLTSAKAVMMAEIVKLFRGEPIRGDTAQAHKRTVKKLEITDATKIPRQYLVPDADLIEAALKKGAVIDGATLKDVSTVVVS